VDEIVQSWLVVAIMRTLMGMGTARLPVNLIFLEHPQQFGLKMRVHFTDFVQQQGAVVGQFELAQLAHHGPGKGAFFVAEQFAFQQPSGGRHS